MTPEQTAMRAKAEQAFALKFEHLGDPNPEQSAADAVTWLLRAGWRPWPALADGPPPRRPAPSAVARAELAKAREVLDAKRRARQETDQ
ncbi:hypothetical protein [Mycolicibacterium sp.]|uniref:hypothetical protein n=1 Tax=Mycolicibacterium sp. TaxID=2320850 RepID=UPI00355E8D7C